MSMGVVISILAAVWWVVSTVLAAQAKKQEQEKQRELARQVQQAAGGEAGNPATAHGTGPSRSQSLADRRRDQLRQLRARKAAGKQATPSADAEQSDRHTIRTEAVPFSREARAQGKATPHAPPTSQISSALPAPSKVRHAITVLEPGRGKLRQQESAADRRAELQRRRAERQQEIDAARARTEHERQKQEAEMARREAATRARIVRRTAPVTPMASKSSSARVRHLLRDRRTLRDLFVLKELLEPPVSQRASHPG